MILPTRVAYWPLVVLHVCFAKPADETYISYSFLGLRAIVFDFNSFRWQFLRPGLMKGVTLRLRMRIDQNHGLSQLNGHISSVSLDSYRLTKYGT